MGVPGENESEDGNAIGRSHIAPFPFSIDSMVAKESP